MEVYVHRGAGAYICGEETSLIESLEVWFLLYCPVLVAILYLLSVVPLFRVTLDNPV